MFQDDASAHARRNNHHLLAGLEKLLKETSALLLLSASKAALRFNQRASPTAARDLGCSCLFSVARRERAAMAERR